MYLDIRGLVTCGVGNLIDPVSEALKVPWKKQSGALASPQEVSGAWHALKARQDLARKGTVHALALTGLVITDADVDALVARRLAENEAYIIKHVLPNFDTIPADAQLGILSMAWAVGAGLDRKFPIFTLNAQRGRWWDCAPGCKIREEGNPGVVPRNKANRLCFENASAVVAAGADRSVLHWPNAFTPLAREEDSPPLAPPVATPEQFGGGGASALALERALEVGRDATRAARDAHIHDEDAFESTEPPTRREGNS